jgi:hypothetical protein
LSRGGDLLGQWRGANTRRPDHGLGFDVFAAGKRHAGFIQRRDAGAEPRLHTDLAQGLLNDGARSCAHIGGDRAVALDDDDAGLGILAEDLAKPRRHFCRRLDAGETAAGHDDCVASVHGRPLGEVMQMLVEGNRIVERVDAEAVLGKTGNVRTEQPAAGGHDQAVVGEALLCTFGGDDAYRAGFGLDGFDAALHIDDVDRLEHIEKRRGERLGLRLIEPRANHQRRLEGDQRDLEFVGRDALDLAQAGSRKGSIHAGEAGADDN